MLYKKTIGGATLSFTALALDSSGRLYLTGGVSGGDLPATSGAFLATVPAGAPFGFAMRLTAAGVIDYATYLGDAAQNPWGIAADASGAAFVTWSSNSTSFPGDAAGEFRRRFVPGAAIARRLKTDLFH